MKPRTKYTVTFSRDQQSGVWVAEVKGLRGCLTQGRTIEQARVRIREALQAWFDLSKPFAGEIVDEVALPPVASVVVEEARSARSKAADADALASSKSRAAIRELVKLGLSLRDAGELLGLSRQRAQQLVGGVKS